MTNLVALYQRVISRGTRKIRARWGPAPRDGACLAPEKHAPPHIGHRAEFNRCWSNGTSVRTEIDSKTGRPTRLPFKVT